MLVLAPLAAAATTASSVNAGVRRRAAPRVARPMARWG